MPGRALRDDGPRSDRRSSAVSYDVQGSFRKRLSPPPRGHGESEFDEDGSALWDSDPEKSRNLNEGDDFSEGSHRGGGQ
eukprot:2471074-Rhodomonas_salina.2